MTTPLKILVVEDSRADTELMLRELQRAGFEPDWLRVETEAAYVSNLHADLDLILSDYRMPQFDGLRALELLKKRGLDIPFILISGTIGEDMAVEAMKQGATDYLLKDRLARLGQSVHHALEESRRRRERKTATETLKLREVALNSVSQGVVISDEHHLIIYANASFTLHTGYEEHEILGRNCSFLQGPGTDPETVLRIRAALDRRESFDGEILNYRKDGQTFWNDLSISPLADEDGGDLRFIGIQRDITERKRAEEALRRSEERFSGAFEHAPICMALVSPEGRFLKVNHALCDVVGYSEAELLHQTFQKITHPEDLEIDLEKMRRLLGGWIFSYQMEKRYVHASGLIVPVLLSVSLVRDGAGRPLYLIKQIQDMTERKQAEESIRVSSERLEIATKAGGIGIWEFDCRAGVVTWDDQMFVLYGQTREGSDAVSERWANSIHPDDRARTEAELDQAVHDKTKPFNTEFRIIRKNDGATRYVRAISSVHNDESGNVWRMIGTNIDVTEEREREHALSVALAQEKELSDKARAGDRAKGEFLAVMSHEIRTPLNGILGFSELLAKMRDLPCEAREYVETISSSGEALLRILNDVLDYSRLEAEQVQVEKADFAPRQILGDIVALLSQQAQDKGLAFGVSIDESIPEKLTGDPGRLRQIVLNLAGNALKFTESGGVTLGLRPVPGTANCEFFVRDTGCGIPPGDIERIFQPFTQADSSISRRHGGSGLGLSISRRLAWLLGGTLTVRSHPGEGSEFILSVKLDEVATTPECPPTLQILDSSFAAGCPLRILIVEDDAVNLKLMLNMIRRLGYEPLAAKNGVEAVEIQRRESADCVLMDLQMPEMGGIEAALAIRSLEKSSPGHTPAFISAVTANIVPADRQRCFDAGMNSYLNKPMRMAGLASLLTEAASHVMRP